MLVIRLVVDLPLFFPTDTDALRGLDDATKKIDLLSVLRAAAGGKHMLADIRGSQSPFARLRRPTVKLPYNQLFDAVMYLPESVPLGGLR